MTYLYGIANHSPEKVFQELIKSGIIKTPRDVHIVLSNTYLERCTKKVICFLSAKDVSRNASRLMQRKFDDTNVFVFDAAISLCSLEVTPLDYEPDPDFPNFGFKHKPLSRHKLKSVKTRCKHIFRRVDILPHLIAFVREGSLLNPLMTFIYNLPTPIQTKVKVAIVNWVYYSKNERALNRLLDSVDGATLSDRVKDKARDILLSEIAQKYQNFFEEYRKDKTALQRLAEFAVSSYEVNYILNVAKSDNSFADSYDKAKNRKR